MSRVAAPVDHYGALGISPSATDADVRRAWQACAKALHPDTSPHGGNADDFQRAKEAYDVLRDADARLRYDSGGLTSRFLAVEESPEDAARMKSRADEFKRRYQSPDFKRRVQMRQDAARIIQTLLRPRVVFLLPLLALGSWLLTSKTQTQTPPADAVIVCWFNPASNRWERPDPLHPAFRQNRHTLRRIPLRALHSSDPTPFAAASSDRLH